MNVVCFRYFGKIGHFLRAEANANGISYPVPPRTILLGLVGAVLGLTKDEPQVKLAGAELAVGGDLPKRFWHKTNARKDPPAPLPYRVKKADKGNASEQRNFRFPQEWLWRPDFRIWAHLPGDYHAHLALRLQKRRWHFTPCLGLAWMLADLEYLGEREAETLPVGTHRIASVVRQDAGKIDLEAACAEGLTLQSIRMPADATADRVFTQRAYWVEFHGRPFPVTTGEAWRWGSESVVFL
jgi:CRISPR-associated protein Cas5h